MRKKKLLTAVISLALVIAVALPGTLAFADGKDPGDTPTETTAPTEATEPTVPTEATEPSDPAEGTKPTEPTDLPACTCGAAEGETHKEGCPLYIDPNTPAEPTEASEPTGASEPTDGDEAPKVLECTCEPQRGEGELHESTCPLYEGDKHIEGCTDECKDPACECGCHLFNRIMACTELEELWNIFYSATEEERAALTDEQFEQIDTKVKSLESVPAMVVTMESDVLLIAPSDIETPSRSFTSVAPFLSPVEGTPR